MANTINGLSKQAPAARESADLLWKHQLRKENAAILKKLDEGDKVLQALAETNIRRFEEIKQQLAAFGSRLSSLEKDLERDRSNMEVRNEEFATLSTVELRVGEISERHTIALRAEADSTEETHSTAVAPTESRVAPLRVTSIDLDQALGMEIAESPEPSVESASVAPQPNDEASGKTRESMSQQTRRRSLRSSASISRHPTTTPTLRPAPLKSNRKPVRSKLSHQGKSSMKAYWARANELFKKPRDGERENLDADLIDLFIRGLKSHAEREKLTKKLTRLHPARYNPDGTFDIICKWSKVKDGLEKAGLLEAET